MPEAARCSVSVVFGQRAPAPAPGTTGADGGPGHARAAAVRQSHGDYLCFLDSDDLMVPERVAKQVRRRPARRPAEPRSWGR